MLELLKVLTAYVQMTTGMAALTDANMPQVELTPVCDIITIFEGPGAPCDTSTVHVGAVYITQFNRILIPDDTDWNNAAEVSILLHELVHAQQQHDPVWIMKGCEARETQAYAVQMKWMREVAKQDPVKELGIPNPQVGASYSCGIPSSSVSPQ